MSDDTSFLSCDELRLATIQQAGTIARLRWRLSFARFTMLLLVLTNGVAVYVNHYNLTRWRENLKMVEGLQDRLNHLQAVVNDVMHHCGWVNL